MAETVIGTTLVRRRAGSVLTAVVALATLSLAAWVVTVALAWAEASGVSLLWLAALLVAVLAAWTTVLTLRAPFRRIELSPTTVRVRSLTGRRSVSWDDVVAVGLAAPYLGLLGVMPVLRLRDHRAISVDALSGRTPAVVADDRDRIAQYRSLPGLPTVVTLPPAGGPAGAVSGGALRVPWGGPAALPNDPAVVARVLASRVLRPLCVLVGFVALLITLVAIGLRSWTTAETAAAVSFACAVIVGVVIAWVRPASLTAAQWRGREFFAWPGVQVDVEERVNLWGTRMLGQLVVTPPGGAPVRLAETWRPVADAHALAQVARSY